MTETLINSLLALEPHLNSSAKKDLQALKKLFHLFPEQDIEDIEKTVESLIKSSKTSLPVLKERANAFFSGSNSESIDDFLKDLNSLSVMDLKKFGQLFQIELSGTKKDKLEAVKKWLSSKGEIKPKSAKEQANEKAIQIVGNLQEKMRGIDNLTADEILNRINSIYNELNKDEFQAFAKILGVSVSGTKQNMKKQLENYVNRAAISHTQTQF